MKVLMNNCIAGGVFYYEAILHLTGVQCCACDRASQAHGYARCIASVKAVARVRDTSRNTVSLITIRARSLSPSVATARSEIGYLLRLPHKLLGSLTARGLCDAVGANTLIEMLHCGASALQCRLSSACL